MTRAGGVAMCMLAVLVLAGCGGPDGSRAAAPQTTVPETAGARTTAPAPASGPATAATTAAAERTRWVPAPAGTWQYQLSGEIDLSVPADVYDIDGQETDAGVVRSLHEAGRHVICYLNAGAYEDWRPDAAEFPADVLGRPLDGWPGERWVDVRRLDVLLPILGARMDVCRSKGFDAVEPDNVDGYANETGFDLTGEDQAAFNTAVAGLARDRGLAVGLKNDIEQVAQLEPHFDFAVNEECLAYDECAEYRPFTDAAKAVFHVEYSKPSAPRCARAARLGFSTVFKDLELDAPLRRC